jgi:hypothetical protein
MSLDHNWFAFGEIITTDLPGACVARSDSVTSSHTLFSNTVVNSCMSRTYNAQVKNAVMFERNE